jgi:hypothetical protein
MQVMIASLVREIDPYALSRFGRRLNLVEVYILVRRERKGSSFRLDFNRKCSIPFIIKVISHHATSR